MEFYIRYIWFVVFLFQGQPWPASAEGYQNFSQQNPVVAAASTGETVSPATPASTSNQVIKLDFSKAGIDVVAELQNALAPKLATANTPSSQERTISFPLEITPPANSGKEFITLLQNAIKTVVSKLAPTAGSQMQFRLRQTSNGSIVAVKLALNVIIPATTQTVTTSNVPDIDLTQSTAALPQSLQTILLNQLSQKGYVAGSNQVQNFDLAFSVLPPGGSTKDYVKLHILRPLQTALRQVAPGASITAISVNTQERGDEILRQTVNFSIQVNPSAQPTREVTEDTDIVNRQGEILISPTESTILPKNENMIPKNAVTAPLVDLTKPEVSLNDIQVSLNSVLSPKANPEPSKPKILAIPIQIRPPSGTTPEQFQQNFVKPIEEQIEKLEPTGKVLTSTTNDLPNGDLGTIVYFEVPSVENTNTYKNLVKNEPVVSTHDINLDEPGATVTHEVSKALVSSLVINPKKKDKSAIINMNVYTPPNSSPVEVQNVVDNITSDLKKQEPTGEVVSAKVNPNPSEVQPDAVVSYLVPSIKDSKTAQRAKNAISVPIIDINQPGVNLVDEIQDVLKNNADKINPDETTFFNMGFKMNPFSEKGSVETILKALKAADPDGIVASYKIRTGDDGFEYLDVVYLLRIEQKPIKEAVVDINTKNPFSNLLKNVVNVVGSAQDNLKGVAQKGEMVDLTLNFRLTNTEGLSDSQIAEIIKLFYPSLKSYIGQALPGSEIRSSETYCPPNSDDVFLRTTVRTRYDPDDVIIIEEVHKKKKVTTTERTGIFGFKIFT